ncbi:MAG: TlpA family protein disulfide reductase [Acidimicrobiia bacterium]
MRRIAWIFALVAVVNVACSSAPSGPLPPAPTPVSYEELSASIAASGVPTVVNVWASWCSPCRSEAPLVSAASLQHDHVQFIGLNVRDNEQDAREFIATYLADADMVHVSDRSGRIPIDMGGSAGVPVTFFYRANGELAEVHLGIIDEPALARLLDEIDR